MIIVRQRIFSKKEDTDEERDILMLPYKEDRKAVKKYRKNIEAARNKKGALEGDEESTKKHVKRAYRRGISKGAILGTALGALEGAGIGNSIAASEGKNPGRGGIIGGITGAAIGNLAGAGIGASVGKKTHKAYKNLKDKEEKDPRYKEKNERERDLIAVASGEMKKRDFAKKWDKLPG